MNAENAWPFAAHVGESPYNPEEAEAREARGVFCDGFLDGRTRRRKRPPLLSPSIHQAAVLLLLLPPAPTPYSPLTPRNEGETQKSPFFRICVCVCKCPPSLLTFLVELPDDGLDEVVGRHKVPALRDADHGDAGWVSFSCNLSLSIVLLRYPVARLNATPRVTFSSYFRISVYFPPSSLLRQITVVVSTPFSVSLFMSLMPLPS